MIRAVDARVILEALARVAESGSVFEIVNKCAQELDAPVRIESRADECRDWPVNDLELSVRLSLILEECKITTVRQLEAMTAKELLRLRGTRRFGKRQLREVREALASLGMKLKGDP